MKREETERGRQARRTWVLQRLAAELRRQIEEQGLVNNDLGFCEGPEDILQAVARCSQFIW